MQFPKIADIQHRAEQLLLLLCSPCSSCCSTASPPQPPALASRPGAGQGSSGHCCSCCRGQLQPGAEQARPKQSPRACAELPTGLQAAAPSTPGPGSWDRDAQSSPALSLSCLEYFAHPTWNILLFCLCIAKQLFIRLLFLHVPTSQSYLHALGSWSNRTSSHLHFSEKKQKKKNKNKRRKYI